MLFLGLFSCFCCFVYFFCLICWPWPYITNWEDLQEASREECPERPSLELKKTFSGTQGLAVFADSWCIPDPTNMGFLNSLFLTNSVPLAACDKRNAPFTQSAPSVVIVPLTDSNAFSTLPISSPPQILSPDFTFHFAQFGTPWIKQSVNFP